MPYHDEPVCVIPSWQSGDLLEVCLPSLKKTCTAGTRIFVVLNEADVRSVSACVHHSVEFMTVRDNLGPGSIDYAMEIIKQHKYVINANTDMIFNPGS